MIGRYVLTRQCRLLLELLDRRQRYDARELERVRLEEHVVEYAFETQHAVGERKVGVCGHVQRVYEMFGAVTHHLFFVYTTTITKSELMYLSKPNI